MAAFFQHIQSVSSKAMLFADLLPLINFFWTTITQETKVNNNNQRLKKSPEHPEPILTSISPQEARIDNVGTGFFVSLHFVVQEKTLPGNAELQLGIAEKHCSRKLDFDGAVML